MNSLQKILRLVAIAGIFALPLVPLFVSTSLFFPYITGKNFAFRIIVELVTGLALMIALVNLEYRPKRTWLLTSFALFVAVMALADAFGAYPFKSFWSNYERMDGWVTIAHLLLYTTALSVLFKNEKMWEWLFRWSLAISILVSYIGIGQSLGQNAPSRIDATFGNPIYLAIYMLFNIFIALFLWVRKQYEKSDTSIRALWGIFYSVAIVLDTIALVLSKTRGSELGLIVGLFVTTALVATMAKHAPRVRNICIGLTISMMVLGALFLVIRKEPYIENIPVLNSLSTLSTNENDVHARILNMGIALQGLKERPLLGWGQENYALVFDKYYDPRMYAQEPWFDRVHNILFDWLITGGILGLLSYLSIFFATMVLLWRGDVFRLYERAILTGLFVGYFVHNMTVFDNVVSYIWWGTVLAYLIYRQTKKENSQALLSQFVLPPETLPLILFVVTALTFYGVYLVNYNAYAANQALISGLGNHDLKSYEAAIAYGSFGNQEAREQLSQAAMEVIAAPQVPTAIKDLFASTTVREMNIQSAVSPLDARFPLFTGILQNAYGKYDLGAVYLEKAHQLSPKKQSILFALGQNAQLRGKNDEAVSYFKQAYELLQEDKQAAAYYAAALIRAGMNTDAETLVKDLSQNGSAIDPSIANAFISQKQYKSIIVIWTPYVALHPMDAQASYTLAVAYYEQGDSDKAIEILNTLVKNAPEAQSAVAPVIDLIKKGKPLN